MLSFLFPSCIRWRDQNRQVHFLGGGYNPEGVHSRGHSNLDRPCRRGIRYKVPFDRSIVTYVYGIGFLPLDRTTPFLVPMMLLGNGVRNSILIHVFNL